MDGKQMTGGKSVSLVAVKPEVDGFPADLGTLATEINRQCEKAERSATQALSYAYAAGAALLTAQELVPPGKWMRWLEANITISASSAQRFMKFTTYKAELDGAGVTSITEAIRMTQAELTRPRPNKAEWLSSKTPDAVRRIQECRGAGMFWKDIAAEMGFSVQTVRSWGDPVYEAKRKAGESARAKERAKRRQAHMRTDRQMERDELARERKGKPANAYSLVRRCLLELDQAIGGIEDASTRAALREAIRHCYRAEDFIVAALRGSAVADPTIRRISGERIGASRVN